MTEPRELTRLELKEELLVVGHPETDAAHYEEALRKLYEHDDLLHQRLDRALNYINHPICLVCGALEPCELKNDPNSPCTFDPTPRQLYDENKQLRQRLEQAEQSLCDGIRNLGPHCLSERRCLFSKLSNQLATAERERDEARHQVRDMANERNQYQQDLATAQATIQALAKENNRLKEVLTKIAKPALGGKQQQWLAQAALAGEE